LKLSWIIARTVGLFLACLGTIVYVANHASRYRYPVGTCCSLAIGSLIVLWFGVDDFSWWLGERYERRVHEGLAGNIDTQQEESKP